jgi:hypothetical protein
LDVIVRKLVRRSMRETRENRESREVQVNEERSCGI